jgi:hypothetical protein
MTAILCISRLVLEVGAQMSAVFIWVGLGATAYHGEVSSTTLDASSAIVAGGAGFWISVVAMLLDTWVALVCSRSIRSRCAATKKPHPYQHMPQSMYDHD